MKWENLKENKCPHCSSDLFEEDDELKCTGCYFHIHRDRAESIKKHRGNPSSENTLKMKWQHLHEGKCPMCGDMLLNIGGFHNTMKCVAAACTFTIRQARMQEIMADPEHPANRFHKAPQEAESADELV